MRKVVVLALSLLLFAIAHAQPRLGMVTSLSGEISSGGEKLRTLDFVVLNQKVRLQDGARAAFSYIDGGKRYTVTGPCSVTFLEDGLRKDEGKGSIDAMLPKKRVGVRLPQDLNLDFGGQIRRGELKLHVSRTMLPGVQTLYFSGTPAYQRFYLSLFDSQGRKFESGELAVTEWSIPPDILKPGETYDVILEGVTDSGRTEIVEREGVTTLDESTAEEVLRTLAETEGSTDLATRIEVLVLLLHHQLDAHALDCLKSIPKTVDSDPTLSAPFVLLRPSWGTNYEYGDVTLRLRAYEAADEPPNRPLS